MAFWRICGHLCEGASGRPALAVVRSMAERASVHAACTRRHVGEHAGDYAAAKELLQETLALFREIDDPKNTACALDALAYLAIEQAEYAERGAARQVVDSARATNDRWMLYPSLSRLATALHRQGNWAAARELYEQLLVVARELGTPWQMGFALTGIGRANATKGVAPRTEALAEGMTTCNGLGDRPESSSRWMGTQVSAAATRRHRRAVRLWGAADALRQETGSRKSVHESIVFDRQVMPVRAMLAAEAFDQAWHEGRAMAVDDVVRYALDEQTVRDS